MNSIVSIQPRAIVHRTTGRTRGPITRLVSPGDLGQLLKPFVFLDRICFTSEPGKTGFGMHPHSGIATLTYMIEGELAYEDTTGKSGVLLSGGVEWMSAGNGVWHDAQPVNGSAVRGFQLWVALPAAQENGPAQSVYLSAAQVAQQGPANVLLGRYGSAKSSLPAPEGMNYLAVQLKDGEHWRYTPPAGHSVGWLAVNTGQLDAGGPVGAGELVIFEESDRPIDIVAKGDTHFVLGSAVKHPHDLVTGYYSVHTSKAALIQGELEIERIGALLREEGRL
ncbi:MULTISPECIES: pirin family protein [Pseudomonas]|uniref:Pirin-like protein n=1 Tax=Pseudomonas syringae pv. aptata TaxID=83167 RepID=A0A0Q0DXI3_PSEAP|nr:MULTISPECIES: pirin family protein [Pseudomonas]KMY04739.1 pirin [Pseudomonas syringae KCTC 12500]KPY72048.1 Pirin-like protein [Pseudomonas syringae pv. syringae]KPZ03325.1 Pirin-like protein [Pseudomonas syringae pv. aptata]MBI6717516.1 pirin family protein [Pseudomonas syringae]MBI6756541.1 pirin family protein [Pseudomonas syringae]